MNPNSPDYKICEHVITSISSKKYENSNYLFLEPVNLTHFPTYTSIVSKPMDLGTNLHNLKNGLYKSRLECLNDTARTFENAELFHADKPKNGWIIDFALKMKKYMKKELKNALKKYNQNHSSVSNSENGGSSGVSRNSNVSPMTSSDNDAAAGNAGHAGHAGTGSTSSSKSKPKSKLSISLKNINRSKSPANATSDNNSGKNSNSNNITSNSTSERKKKKKSSSSTVKMTDVGETSASSKPRLSLKLNNKIALSATTPTTAQSTTSAAASAASAASAVTQEKTNENKNSSKTPKPKLKLKLGLSKKTPGSSTPKPSLSSTPKTTTTSKLSSNSSLASSSSQSTKKSATTASATTSSTTTNTTTKTTTTTSAVTTPTTTAKSSNKSSKPTSTPKSTPSSQSRGKELPTAIAAAKANAKKESSSSSSSKSNTKKENNSLSSTKKSTSKKSPTPPVPSNNTPTTTITIKKDQRKKTTTTTSSSTQKSKNANNNNTSSTKSSSLIPPQIKGQCSKVLSALKQRGGQDITWFTRPVKSFIVKAIFEDYHKKILNPMDLATMTNKLERNSYASLSDFVLDLRRIFANCLRYNTASSKDDLRAIARNILITTEQFLHLFITVGLGSSVGSSKAASYPKLLYCWKTCLEIIDAILDLKNPDDTLQTVHYFLSPASFFFGGKLSQKYKDKVKSPMDFGTIQSNLIEGKYQNVDTFVHDCKLVTANCKMYYQSEENGETFIAQATRLEDFMLSRLDALVQYDRSEKGLEAKKIALNPTAIKLLKPPNTFYSSMLDDLRSLTYTDKYTKITEKAATQFENPVDTNVFKDYLQYVEVPMNLKAIENKIFLGSYQLPEDFEYEVNLIFKNCEAYNIPKSNNHIVNLSKHCARAFRKTYASRIKALQASDGKNVPSEPKKEKKRPADSQTAAVAAPASKKIKLEVSTARRKSPTLPTQANRQPNSKGKSPKTQGGGKRVVPRIVIRNDGPLPLHVAIAKIKQGFSRRRQHKELQSWEGACSRFFREFKRHPWISTSKRFVFDAPVPMLHPEIKEAYMMQIKNPMDLTTAEGKLLQGGIYNEAQEFIDDVALVFANAVTFNKSGHEQGDPTSMAYFEASSHLLRYTRWLSLEHLSPFLVDDSHSEGIRQSGPLPHWKLTVSNQNDARHEMEQVVIHHSIEKSDEGDRYTWYEVECEKLLKSLRHQSDQKKMQYFIFPSFPSDYVAIISKPIEWETCNRKLQQRQYETFGDIVSDLRLIFTNAVKYNGRVKDIDPTSKDAYDSALYMSGKLEAAIQRLYITAADRIEREKVEDIILEREAVINEKAEEERLRAEWENQREQARRSGSDSTRTTLSQSVKIVQRRPARRDLNFDNPFNDQENSYEQSEIEALNKHKIMYEKQQRDRADMHLVAKNVGIRVIHDLFWRSQAIHWAKDMSENIQKIQQSLSQDRDLQQASERSEKGKQGDNTNSHESAPKASVVASLLGDSSRSQVRLEISKLKQTKKKKRKRLFLE